MSRGRIARASRRYPDARRRAARYGRTQVGRRTNGLPPHLLSGVTRRAPAGANPNRLRLLLIGARLLAVAFVLAFAGFVVSTVAGVAGTMAAYRQVNGELPNAGAVAVGTFQTTRIFDRNGVLLQQVDDPENLAGGWRSFVPLSEVSQDVIDATVAAEDATFWTHDGVEPLAIVRGVVINLGGQGSSGGSTITQQLVRSLFPNQIGYDISYTRKAKEALAAVALERRYAKHDILTMYLNQIFYGNRSYGIEAAAETFFDKKAKDLTLAEAAMLAGLPQRPTAYNPVINFDLAKQRQEYVLDQMVKLRYITRQEADAALAAPLQVATGRDSAIHHAPHFANYVRDYVRRTYGEDALLRGGLQITTTIDVGLQDRAEEIVREQVAKLAMYNAHNACMVVILPWSGEIVAMVGSANFDDPLIKGQVNVAVSDQQPGSAIKPVAYAAAFESGWNPGTVVLDTSYKKETPGATDPVTGQPIEFYEPQNYTGRFYGAVSVRTALANSLNIPAVKALEYATIPDMIDLAHRMGIKQGLNQENPQAHYGLSLALGGGEVQPLELTNVYATFANNGKYVPATPILKIEDGQGNVLFDLDRDHALERAEQALKAEYAYQITSILTDNDSRGLIFGRDNLFGQTQQQLGRPTAAKSGTTNNWKDIWTMGYTTDVAIGVWVGNTENEPLAEIDGIQGAGPIWQRMMLEIHQSPTFSALLRGPNGQALPEEFARPLGIVEGPVCIATGNRPTGGEEARREILVRGEGPALRCDQLSAYQRTELRDALEDIRKNAGKYDGPGVDSVRRYARAARVAERDVGAGFEEYQPPLVPNE